MARVRPDSSRWRWPSRTNRGRGKGSVPKKSCSPHPRRWEEPKSRGRTAVQRRRGQVAGEMEEGRGEGEGEEKGGITVLECAVSSLRSQENHCDHWTKSMPPGPW